MECSKVVTAIHQVVSSTELHEPILGIDKLHNNQYR